MKLICIIAVGERKFGDLALNLALSIKCNNPEQKIALIYEFKSLPVGAKLYTQSAMDASIAAAIAAAEQQASKPLTEIAYEEIGEILIGGVDHNGEYEECEAEIYKSDLYKLQERLLKSINPFKLKLYVGITAAHGITGEEV